MDEKIIHTKIIKTAVLLLAAFFIVTCKNGGGGGRTSNVKMFDYRVQGRWESSNKDEYSGTLVITTERITITGYSKDQTKKNEDDNKRPFKQLPKDRAMKGYSEEGKIFIINGDSTESIPYYYWEDNPPPSYNLVHYLRFNFGGRNEDLDYMGPK